MKNIHVISTSKPSKLLKDLVDKTYQFKKEATFGNRIELPLNIYITSNEEIKEGDYFLYDETTIRYKTNGTEYHGGDLCHISGIRRYPVSESKKIILTTDPLLDGVQPIDDEFLEWFVKNPTCENIPIIMTTVSKESTYKTNIGFESWRKEEPKQDAINYSLNAFKVPKEYFGKEEPKQETLKEVAKRLSNTTDEFNQFVAGAKWQQEQDKTKYSEEEVFELLKKFAPHIRYNHKELPHTWQQVVKEWFEQFKNK